MASEQDTPNHELVSHEERQTKALEALVLMAQIALFLGFVGAVVWLIAVFGN